MAIQIEIYTATLLLDFAIDYKTWEYYTSPFITLSNLENSNFMKFLRELILGFKMNKPTSIAWISDFS